MSDIKMPPAVIFCGGMGTRLREITELTPKPMVQIGEQPILWHIMKCYAAFGVKRFILCLGYKREVFTDYFINYRQRRNDFTLTCREVCCICLCREIARVIFTSQGNVELFECNVFTDLSQESHSFGIMHGDVFKASIFVHIEENTRSRTFVITHSYFRTWHQA